jgi:tape measure domain-containing protein
MADDKKTLELQIRVAAGEALRAVASLKGEMQSLAGEMRKLSESDGAAVKRTFEETQAAADKAAASMKLFGATSGELRQMQARLKDAAAEVVAKGFDPQSEEVKKLVEEYRRLGKEAGELDKAAGKNINSFGDLKNALGSLAQVAALTKAIGVIKDMGAFALSAADTFQTARNEFGTLLGDMQAGAGLFNQIKAFNDKTPFSLDTLTQATKVLLAAKVPLAELQKQLTKFGDLSQGNSQKFTSYINAFSKAAAKGRADMETLNTYLNQGVPILDALGERFGVTGDEIIEMAGQGKIGFEDFSAALEELTAEGGRYFGGMELGSRSLSAMQEGLRESVNSLAASFGEMFLPAAIKVVETLTGITNAINNSPLLKGALAGALVALAGYLATMAVKAGIAFAAQMSLNFAIGALNPMVLTATVAAAGLAAMYVKQAAEQQKVARGAEDLTLQMYRQKAGIDSVADAIQHYKGYLKDLSDDELREQIERFKDPLNLNSVLIFDGDLLEGRKVAEELQKTLAGRRADFITSMLSGTDTEKVKKLNADLADALKFLSDPGLTGTEASNLQLIISNIRTELEKLNASAGGSKKKWQEWFGEITKIDPALFGSSGQKAAELYLEGFGRSVESSKALSAALGEKFDLASMLRGQQGKIQQTIMDLISIDPKNINESFTFDDAAIKSLVQTFRDLGAAIRSIEYQSTLDGLRKKIDDLGKSENDLALESAKAAGASESELVAYKALMDEYGRKSVLESYRQQVEGLTRDKHDLARASLAAANATEEEKQELEEYIAAIKKADAKTPLEQARQDIVNWQRALSDSFASWLTGFEGISGRTAVILGDLTAQFAELSSAAALGGFEEFGRALGEGQDAAESLQRALAEMARQILRQLPLMFLQAGLQLIANGQWALGLGFVAAAASSAVISGFTDSATENAKGGVYNEYGKAAREYAAGGAFTNRVVSRPTYFRYGGGLGVMGEAGPEAIMPLTRGSNGRLGVSAMGAGGTSVYVIIQNYTNEDVRTEESSDSSGNQIRKIIIGTVRQSISSGEMDQSMSGRYGLRARGV